MFLSAVLLVACAVTVCAIATRIALGALGLDLRQTLLYLGLAEIPPPPAGRRRAVRA